MVEFKFDHTQDDILDACGVTEKQVESLIERINDVGQSCIAASEIVEKVGTNFTSTELAFIVNHLQMQVRHANNPEMMIQDLIEGVKISIGIDAEDNDIHLPPLGQGGEA